MNVDYRLHLALAALHTAHPDFAQWSGPAAISFESRLREQVAALMAIQAGLWR